MKSEIKMFYDNEKKYPKLMKYSGENPFVVLMVESGKGTVVWTKNIARFVGETEQDSVGGGWAMCQFKDFHGSVTISSED